jgi:hypothetical protein
MLLKKQYLYVVVMNMYEKRKFTIALISLLTANQVLASKSKHNLL